jgi:alkanesulfonate monooxygenase SsuD/methylene tetrahydromethanopterin reductase-like flavin-dependent oxidoreductase (luciferase family)
MQLGFFTMPIHPLGKPWRSCLREDREAIIAADRLGYTEAYVGEHATDLAENITSCAMFIASLADATRTIRLGTGTVNLPNAHPAAVASQIAMLDHLLEGRLNFGISPGGLLSDAEAFGNLDRDRTAMFVEAIDIVLDLWKRDPPYDLRGQFWSISTARTLMPEIGQGILPKPYQQPHPPIVVTAVAPHSKGLISAAARGWLPISANFLLPKWVGTHWPKFVEGRESAGKMADPSDWRVARSVFVADDLATAREYALGAKSPYRHYFSQIITKMKRSGRGALFKHDPNLPDDSIDVDRVLEELVTWGTPDKVVDDLNRFREETGEFGTLLYAGHDWLDERLARRSMQLMADSVMPRIDARPERRATAPGR